MTNKFQQIEFDYCARHENNRESQQLLEDNADRLNGQCKTVLELLKSGIRLTVLGACLLPEPITDLRRRIKDLRDRGFIIKDTIVNGKFKEYYYEKN